jgi:hypothetical protein
LAFLLSSLPCQKLIKSTFQGQLTQTTLSKDAHQKDNQQFQMENKNSGFFFLSLDLPHLSVFKEQQELGTLPQVPIQTLLKKYSGQQFSDESLKLDQNVVAVRKKLEI